MSFDTKIKVILLDGLEPWQELNVTAFLMSGIAQSGEITGEPYEDADGVRYLPMSQQPIFRIRHGDGPAVRHRDIPLPIVADLQFRAGARGVSLLVGYVAVVFEVVNLAAVLLERNGKRAFHLSYHCLARPGNGVVFIPLIVKRLVSFRLHREHDRIDVRPRSLPG